jgi:hypothetical protein
MMLKKVPNECTTTIPSIKLLHVKGAHQTDEETFSTNQAGPTLTTLLCVTTEACPNQTHVLFPL